MPSSRLEQGPRPARFQSRAEAEAEAEVRGPPRLTAAALEVSPRCALELGCSRVHCCVGCVHCCVRLVEPPSHLQQRRRRFIISAAGVGVGLEEARKVDPRTWRGAERGIACRVVSGGRARHTGDAHEPACCVLVARGPSAFVDATGEIFAERALTRGKGGLFY